MQTSTTLAPLLFDPLHYFWERKKTQRFVYGMLVLVFLAGLAVIEANRQGWLPADLAASLPTNHFQAISLAFSLVLIMEVISLIFVLPWSVSRSVGKQIEILCLILLRSSFKELSHFPEPIVFTGDFVPFLAILSDGLGALVIFVLLGVYYRLKQHGEKLRGEELLRFVAAKKIVALILLAVFAGLGLRNAVLLLQGATHIEFFATFYTLLIFTDILLVLISQRYLPSFRAIFRNSGFALATLLMRLALSAPAFINTALGVGAALFAVMVTLVYNRFHHDMTEE